MLLACLLLAGCSSENGDASDAAIVDATTTDGSSTHDGGSGTSDGALDASGEDAANDAGMEPDAEGPIECTRTPREPGTCCFTDEDCSGSRCIDPICSDEGEGICKVPPAESECWDVRDCPDGYRCEGAIICPCGVFCIAPDEPGRCEIGL